jgi:tetratricopeptide (TPR) repeat protein
MIDEGNLETARPLLAQAFQRYPVNVDILISMYQLDGDETWRNLVDRTLEVNVRQIEQSIQDVREDAKRFGQPIVLELGYQLNQYAWLVANTTGNKEKALKYSLESLNISNDSAKMDTCARWYFAVKDYDNALRMQKLALKQSPYSPPLLRQLKLIEDAIENQKSSDAGKSAS